MVKGDSCSESLAYSTPTCLPSEGHRDPREQEETEETGCWIPCLGSSLSRSVNEGSGTTRLVKDATGCLLQVRSESPAYVISKAETPLAPERSGRRQRSIEMLSGC